MMNNRVAVTGMGAICGLGNSLDEVWQNLIEGKNGISIIERDSFNQEKISVNIAGSVKGFDLAEDNSVEFKIVDMAGKLVYKLNVDGKRGYNTITLDADDIGITGVFYYEINTGDFIASKKLIVLE